MLLAWYAIGIILGVRQNHAGKILMILAARARLDMLIKIALGRHQLILQQDGVSKRAVGVLTSGMVEVKVRALIMVMA